jgi:hypothetical protein
MKEQKDIQAYRGWNGTKAAGAAAIFLVASYMLAFGVIDQASWVWALGIAASLLGGGDIGARMAARSKSSINNF